MKINTELCVDLKTLLQSDPRLVLNKWYTGMLVRDGEYHCKFIELDEGVTYKRNPRVYSGEYFTITRKKNGELKFNFKPIEVYKNFSIDYYALCVWEEIRKSLPCLIEK